MTRLQKSAVIAIALTALVIIPALIFGPARLEQSLNTVIVHSPYEISEQARALHRSMVVGDLHSDSTLWDRDLLERADRGHVDIPRMREGGATLQIFTTVTKSPSGQNYNNYAADAADTITVLALLQAWPPSTWVSLTARALYQAEKLRDMAQRSPERFALILTKANLNTVLMRRARGEPIVGGVLGTEGSHALDGKLENVQRLYDAGFRMMSLQHFFDNALGGSLHGESGMGLTAFGRQVVDKMVSLNIMIDVSHSAPQVVSDVLAQTNVSIMVSHTGFYGHCPSERNISDELMIQIAKTGGLIGVGFWDAAVCDPSPAGIVAAIRYGIDLVGVDHIALGSDFDGAVEAPFDVSELPVLTQEMLNRGFTTDEIRKVMGQNMVDYLRKSLPSS